MVSMHKELKLIRGVPTIPGLDVTLEPGTDLIINLLSGEAEGFALDPSPGAWNPGIPAPKSGLWQDVPFVDGRTPIADSFQNVTETMQVVLSAPNYLRLSQWKSKLAVLAQDIEQFWSQEGIQPSPVYLHWWATDAPGPQFALIMSLDFAESTPGVLDAGSIVRDITLTIEREPYWRALPPGASPILWTLYTLGRQPGKDFNLSNMPTITTTVAGAANQLVRANITDFDEYNPQSVTTVTPVVGIGNIVHSNAISIPSSALPGDVPPLVCVMVQGSKISGADTDTVNIMLACSSRPLTYRDRFNNAFRLMSNLPGLGAFRGAGAAAAADANGLTGYDVNTSTYTAVLSRIEITPGVVRAEYLAWRRSVKFNLYRGRYAAFLRCRQNAVAAGNITMNLAVKIGQSITRTTPVSPTVVVGVGATVQWPLTYMGQIKLPQNPDMVIRADNLGMQDSVVDGNIALEVTRSAGAALLYVRDLLLIPIDEGFLAFEPDVDPPTGGSDPVVFDNTGYYNHGKPGMIAVREGTNFPAVADGDMPSYGMLSGSELVLQPGMDNTLYVAEYNSSGFAINASNIFVCLNIIPRWLGVRDR